MQPRRQMSANSPSERLNPTELSAQPGSYRRHSAGRRESRSLSCQGVLQVLLDLHACLLFARKRPIEVVVQMHEQGQPCLELLQLLSKLRTAGHLHHLHGLDSEWLWRSGFRARRVPVPERGIPQRLPLARRIAEIQNVLPTGTCAVEPAQNLGHRSPLLGDLDVFLHHPLLALVRQRCLHTPRGTVVALTGTPGLEALLGGIMHLDTELVPSCCRAWEKCRHCP
mmetsp:Transcript_109374/g.273978  ORF Transcript_109374/g.273978 Transcript_109374/m.273978 type:complete len:225 (-) Transcript_109374:221-895(-)